MNPTPPPNDLPFPIEPTDPDLLAFARQTFDVQEHLRGVEEIKAGKFRTLDEVIAEIEAKDHKSWRSKNQSGTNCISRLT